MNRITSTNTPGGHRDTLDGRDIHAGAILELEQGNRWVFVRYEYSRGEAWLVLDDDTTLELDPHRMRLRWPER